MAETPDLVELSAELAKAAQRLHSALRRAAEQGDEHGVQPDASPALVVNMEVRRIETGPDCTLVRCHAEHYQGHWAVLVLQPGHHGGFHIGDRLAVTIRRDLQS